MPGVADGESEVNQRRVHGGLTVACRWYMDLTSPSCKSRAAARFHFIRGRGSSLVKGLDNESSAGITVYTNAKRTDWIYDIADFCRVLDHTKASSGLGYVILAGVAGKAP